MRCGPASRGRATPWSRAACSRHCANGEPPLDSGSHSAPSGTRNIAIVDVDDPKQEELTFAEAEYCTTVLANSLLDRGAQPGTTVGLLGRNSRAYAETIVAASRTGRTWST